MRKKKIFLQKKLAEIDIYERTGKNVFSFFVIYIQFFYISQVLKFPKHTI